MTATTRPTEEATVDGVWLRVRVRVGPRQGKACTWSAESAVAAAHLLRVRVRAS